MTTKYSREDVLSFIADQTGSSLSKIDESDIFESLNIEGDDAFEFAEQYSEKFGVSLEDYRWYFHHGEEGSSIGGVFVKPPYARVQKIPLSLGLLVESANAGRWLLEYPEHKLQRHRYDLLINLIVVCLIAAAMAAIVLTKAFG